jgi:hypothetical protein
LVEVTISPQVTVFRCARQAMGQDYSSWLESRSS